MALIVEPRLHPRRIITESFQIGIEPFGYIVALAAHEGNLLIGDDDILKIFHLFHDELVEAVGILGVVPVFETIFHLCSWEIVNDGTAHGELIEVVVSEVSDDLFHKKVVDNDVLQPEEGCRTF